MKYLIVPFFLVGCRNIVPVEDTSFSCNQFKDTIKKIWQFDSVENHYKYFSDLGFFDELDRTGNKYRACMEGKDTSYITKLFGNHYRYEVMPVDSKYPQRLVYMMTKYPCLGKEVDYDCRSLYVYFDKNGKILFVEYHTIHG
jgi:hypothetical protein